MKTSEDLLRYTGKIGFQATKKWYYTTQLIAYTQFMKGYKNNDPFVYSDFINPLNVNLSIGMDYEVSWFNKRLTGNIHLAPAAYNFKYVSRLDLSKRYGLKEGNHTLHGFRVYDRFIVEDERHDKMENSTLWIYHVQARRIRLGEYIYIPVQSIH